MSWLIQIQLNTQYRPISEQRIPFELTTAVLKRDGCNRAGVDDGELAM